MRLRGRAEVGFVDDVLAMLETYDTQHDYSDVYLLGELRLVDGGDASHPTVAKVVWDSDDGGWVVR